MGTKTQQEQPINSDYRKRSTQTRIIMTVLFLSFVSSNRTTTTEAVEWLCNAGRTPFVFLQGREERKRTIDGELDWMDPANSIDRLPLAAQRYEAPRLIMMREAQLYGTVPPVHAQSMHTSFVIRTPWEWKNKHIIRLVRVRCICAHKRDPMIDALPAPSLDKGYLSNKQMREERGSERASEADRQDRCLVWLQQQASPHHPLSGRSGSPGYGRQRATIGEV